MSYCIDISYLEKETIAKVTIYSPSEESRAVRGSQFQCIGWLLDIFYFVRGKVSEIDLVNPEYDQEALVSIAQLSSSQAAKLLTLKTIKERFEYVWINIGEDERRIALQTFCSYDNYWPGFDTYSLMWNTDSLPLPHN